EILLGLPNEIDVRWRLLNGKIASSETRPFLLQAVSMFQENFDAIIDPVRDYLNVLTLATTAFFFFTVMCCIKRAKELVLLCL
ncbi:hypothetical protein HN873_071613, partial [Arachis hypogaea]